MREWIKAFQIAAMLVVGVVGAIATIAWVSGQYPVLGMALMSLIVVTAVASVVRDILRVKRETARIVAEGKAERAKAQSEHEEWMAAHNKQMEDIKRGEPIAMSQETARALRLN